MHVVGIVAPWLESCRIHNHLSGDILLFTMPDNSMSPSEPGQDGAIQEGEQVVVKVTADFAPGDVVCAVLFNPLRQVYRVYREASQNSMNAPARTVAQLVPLNPNYPVEPIRSSADGFILGVVEDVLSVRSIGSAALRSQH